MRGEERPARVRKRGVWLSRRWRSVGRGASGGPSGPVVRWGDVRLGACWGAKVGARAVR